jgi:acyl-coenzyme A synthetase/AMP-(fatty) acid ligase
MAFLSSFRGWLSRLGGATGEAPGMQVTAPGASVIDDAMAIGVDGALQISTVWLCVDRRASVIASLPLEGPWPRGSVGRPLDGIEVRVARGDGTLAPADEVGAVLLRDRVGLRERSLHGIGDQPLDGVRGQELLGDVVAHGFVPSMRVLG